MVVKEYLESLKEFHGLSDEKFPIEVDVNNIQLDKEILSKIKCEVEIFKFKLNEEIKTIKILKLNCIPVSEIDYKQGFEVREGCVVFANMKNNIPEELLLYISVDCGKFEISEDDVLKTREATLKFYDIIEVREYFKTIASMMLEMIAEKSDKLNQEMRWGNFND